MNLNCYFTFQELSSLVHDQGEKVNRLENFIFTAQEKVTAAKDQLKAAQAQQVKSRRTKLKICVVVSIIVAILILCIVISVSYW